MLRRKPIHTRYEGYGGSMVAVEVVRRWSPWHAKTVAIGVKMSIGVQEWYYPYKKGCRISTIQPYHIDFTSKSHRTHADMLSSRRIRFDPRTRNILNIFVVVLFFLLVRPVHSDFSLRIYSKVQYGGLFFPCPTPL